MTELVIDRVVIACDAVGENRSGIEVAASFAQCWNVALHGVFVEDEGLLNLASLPFTRHIGAGGGAEDLDMEAVLRQFEAHAGRVRATLEAAARAHAISCSFDVVRGQPTLTTLSLGDQDLLVIEAASRPFVRDFRLESRWLAAAFAANRPILLARNFGRKTDGIVAVLQRTDAAAERIVSVATRLALAGKRRLTILLGEGAPDRATVLDRIRPLSESLATHCRVEQSAAAPLSSLERLAGEGSLVVVDADPATNDPASLKELAAHTAADILFLR